MCARWGAESFRLCRELLDGVLLVDNRSISGAIEAVFNDKRSILEPAGAVAVAGATQYLEHHGLKVRNALTHLLRALDSAWQLGMQL